jgi:hypothetical protein
MRYAESKELVLRSYPINILHMKTYEQGVGENIWTQVRGSWKIEKFT